MDGRSLLRVILIVRGKRVLNNTVIIVILEFNCIGRRRVDNNTRTGTVRTWIMMWRASLYIME